MAFENVKTPTTNVHTGGLLSSKVSSGEALNNYLNNYDTIFGKTKKPTADKVTQDADESGNVFSGTHLF